MRRGFERVETWVFDLDNTLYPASCRLFDQIDRRMGEFISQTLGVDKMEAKRLQKAFFYEHGTTLRGLMTVYGIEPNAFLDYVHDIDHSVVKPDPALGAAILRLPGKKYIFTNGSRSHAERVAGRLGFPTHFTDIFDIVDANLVPKPERLK